MKFFSRKKTLSDPAIVVSSCLQFLLKRITDELSGQEYSWNKPWGVKRFESIILTKFLLDLTFEKIAEGKLENDEKNGYYDLSNTSFVSLFNAEFSTAGINYEEMKDEIEKKIAAYFATWQEDREFPECYYQIYMLITGSQSREELEKEFKRKTTGLNIMRTKEQFAPMVTRYEAQLQHLKNKVSAFDQAEIVLPHMFRSAREKVKNINLKKIRYLSKKLAKKNKNK